MHQSIGLVPKGSGSTVELMRSLKLDPTVSIVSGFCNIRT